MAALRGEIGAMAPNSAAQTTAPPSTTTNGPSASTTAHQTTAAPAQTTSAAPAQTTTAHAAATTTAAPASSTTSAGGSSAPTFAAGSVKVAIDPDDGQAQLPNSIQVASDAKLTLSWAATNADSVNIDPGDSGLPASGSRALDTQDNTYTLIAVAKDGTQSQPYTIEIHTHPPGQVVSSHTQVGSGIVTILGFAAAKDGQEITSAAAGDSIDLTVTVSTADSVNINGADAPLTDDGNGQKIAKATVTVDAASGGNYACQAMQNGAAAAEQSLHLELVAASSTTAAPASSTTAAAASTTTAAPASSTTATAASTTASPGSTTSAPAASTTAAASTTVPPTTTTAPPSTTTQAQSTTTAAPSTTSTRAPSSTTTAAASSTTTHAPSTTSTHAPSTTSTHAPATTTTSGGAAVTIKGHAPGVAFVIVGADGNPISAGGAITADCTNMEGTSSIFLLKDDSTAVFHGLTAGDYTVYVAEKAATGDTSTRDQADDYWGVDKDKQFTVGADPVTVDMTAA